MGIENPTINFRAPQEFKDLLSLEAKREGREVGPMIRDVLSEHLAVTRTLELMKSVGLTEVIRRLGVPSAFMANDTATSAERLEQTTDNFVTQTPPPVLQGGRA